MKLTRQGDIVKVSLCVKNSGSLRCVRFIDERGKDGWLKGQSCDLGSILVR